MKHKASIVLEQKSIKYPAKTLPTNVCDIGLEPMREEFSLSQVDPIDASLVVNGRTIEGLPLIDGGFTSSAGIRGRVGDLNSDAPVGLTQIVQPFLVGAGQRGTPEGDELDALIDLVQRHEARYMPMSAGQLVEAPPPSQRTPAIEWDEFVGGYRAGLIEWNTARLGPKPSEPGCRAPAEVRRNNSHEIVRLSTYFCRRDTSWCNPLPMGVGNAP
jgi:hypothetical protein